MRPLQIYVLAHFGVDRRVPNGMGCSPAATYSGGAWDSVWQKKHIHVLELEGVFRALKDFSPHVVGRVVRVRSDNTTTVAYINKQGGTRSLALWKVSWNLHRWCMTHDVRLRAIHLPGKENSIADALSRLQDSKLEWSLNDDTVKLVWTRLGVPEVDLFATALNHKLPKYCSLIPHPCVWRVDALSVTWSYMSVYAFPPFALVPLVLEQLSRSLGCEMILIAPCWPGRECFPKLLSLIAGFPLQLPLASDLLKLPDGSCHPHPHHLHLVAWPLSGLASVRRAFRQRLPRWRPSPNGPPLYACTIVDSDCLENGAIVKRFLRLRAL